MYEAGSTWEQHVHPDDVEFTESRSMIYFQEDRKNITLSTGQRTRPVNM